MNINIYIHKDHIYYPFKASHKISIGCKAIRSVPSGMPSPEKTEAYE